MLTVVFYAAIRAGTQPLMMRSGERREDRYFHYAWVVAALAFLTTLTAAGIRSAPSVLIHPLEAEFGWSRAAIALAPSLNLLLYGCAAPFGGWLLDRFG